MKMTERQLQRIPVVVRQPLMSMHSPVMGSKDVELLVEEAERLDKTLKQIVEDTHKWRNKLIEKENESNKLKKELDALLQTS